MYLPKEKGSIGVLVFVSILLIAGVIGGSLLFRSYLRRSSTPQVAIVAKPHPPLKNYPSEPLGFEFKYPGSGYIVVEDSEAGLSVRGKTDFRKNFTGYVGYPPPNFLKAVVLKPDDNEPLTQFDTFPLSLWVFDNPQGLTVDQWYRKYWYYPFIWGESSEPQRSQNAPDNISSVSGQLAKFHIVNYRPKEPKFLYLANNGKMFLFKIIDTTENNNLGSKTLLTFKLLK